MSLAAAALIGAATSCDRAAESERAAALGANMWSEELPLTRVLLFFYPEARGGRLRAEPRRLIVGKGTSSTMKAALVELGRGPRETGLISPFGREFSVRGVYSQEDGTLYVDLGSGAQQVFGKGLSMEVAALRSITNTVFYNFPHVSRLKILVDGEPAVSLGGHIDLGGFLYPEEWLQGERVSL